MTTGLRMPTGEVRSPAQIRADIERTRADLGETVAALAGKADVKARARRAARSTRVRMQHGLRRSAAPVAALAVAAVLVAVSVILRHQVAGRMPAKAGRARHSG